MSYRLGCLRLYWKLRDRFAPDVRSSQLRYAEALGRYVRPGSRWLDIGCGHQLLPAWCGNVDRLAQLGDPLVGVDPDFDALRSNTSLTHGACASVAALPFRSGSFDLVTANMVVEHLEAPARQFAEIRRVLAPGGVFLFHTPNKLGYTTLLARCVPDALKKTVIGMVEGREESDVYPTHYRANSASRIEAHAQAASLEVAELRHVVSDAQFVVFPPLMVVELLWLRASLTRPLERLRTNLVVALRKA